MKISNSLMEFTFADLCAGIGGFRIALQNLGGNCIYSCELDKNCEATYKKNFGDSFDEHDILDIDSETFPKVDILCAGFPCQPFSIAGKKVGFKDPRGQVFFKIADIIHKSSPEVIFLENVPNLVNINQKKTFKEILNILDEIGYNISYKVLNSSNFGVPQNRRRVFIIGFRKDHGINGFLFTEKISNPVSVKSILIQGDNSIPISEKWNTYIDLYTNKITLAQVPFEVPKTRKALERKDLNADLTDCIFQMRSSGIRALSIDKPLPTLAVSVSGGGAMIPVYSKERRHLSLREMARIMGFPDNYQFPVARTHAIKQLANAVCPPVIRSIGKDILFALSRTRSFTIQKSTVIH